MRHFSALLRENAGYMRTKKTLSHSIHQIWPKVAETSPENTAHVRLQSKPNIWPNEHDFCFYRVSWWIEGQDCHCNYIAILLWQCCPSIRRTLVGSWLLHCVHNFSLFYRQDAAKRQTAGIKFTHRPKIRFFAPQGRLVAPIHVKRGRADGHVGPLGCAKFYLNRHRGWECSPKISKSSTFWWRVAATPLTDFLNFRGLTVVH